MKAHAAVVATASGTTTRLAVLRSESPLLLRPASGELWLVGGAGGPLAGDDLSLDVEVGPGAVLVVRSAAASVAQAGPPGIARPSRLVVRARVGEGGSLWWKPEPLVLAAGCNHESWVEVEVGPRGRLEWREEVILGRYGEAPGSGRIGMRVEWADAPLYHQELHVGSGAPGWDGPAVVGANRAVGSVVLAGLPEVIQDPLVAGPTGARVELMRLGGGSALVCAAARSAAALRAALDAGTAAARTGVAAEAGAGPVAELSRPGGR